MIFLFIWATIITVVLYLCLRGLFKADDEIQMLRDQIIDMSEDSPSDTTAIDNAKLIERNNLKYEQQFNDIWKELDKKRNKGDFITAKDFNWNPDDTIDVDDWWHPGKDILLNTDGSKDEEDTEEIEIHE